MHPTILDLTQYQHGIGSEARLEKATHHTDEDRLVMENHEGDADLRGSVSKDSKDSQKKSGSNMIQPQYMASCMGKMMIDHLILVPMQTWANPLFAVSKYGVRN